MVRGQATFDACQRKHVKPVMKNNSLVISKNFGEI